MTKCCYSRWPTSRVQMIMLLAARWGREAQGSARSGPVRPLLRPTAIAPLLTGTCPSVGQNFCTFPKPCCTSTWVEALCESAEAMGRALAGLHFALVVLIACGSVQGSAEEALVDWVATRGGQVRGGGSSTSRAARRSPQQSASASKAPLCVGKFCSGALGQHCQTCLPRLPPPSQVHFEVGRRCAACERGALASRAFAAGEELARIPAAASLAVHGDDSLAEGAFRLLEQLQGNASLREGFAPFLAAMPAAGEVLSVEALPDAELAELQTPALVGARVVG